MAAPLKVQILAGLRISMIRPCLCSRRCISSRRDGRDDGLPPWAAGQPTGKTFYAMQLAQMQNRDIWKKRCSYVNRGWENILVDYNKRKLELADQEREEPAKLLMVKRCKPLWGVSKSLKNIITQLGLNQDNKPVIFKNKQSTNNMLRKVKHLVEIFPVTFPYGLPESEEDLDHCYITDNGQFIVKKKLELAKQVNEDVKVSKEIPENKFELKQEFLDKTLELRKMKWQIHQEYYQTKYVYEKNEDGKQLRYSDGITPDYDKIWH